MQELDPEARQYGMFCHLLALAFLLLPYFGNIIGPLIIWLMKKDQYPWVDLQGKSAINFNISYSIYLFISSIIGVPIGCLTCGIGFLLPGIVFIYWFVLVIIATVQSSHGESFEYPLSIRFIY